MTELNWSTPLALVLGVAGVTTVLIHVLLVPRFFPERLLRSVPYLLAGWGTFLATFYVIGRLVPPTADLPNMRSLDYGIGLVILSLLLSTLFSSAGFTVRAVTELHLLLAPALYAGLGLVGWGLGRRTAVVNRIARREG